MTDAEDELEVLFRAEYRGLVRALAVPAVVVSGSTTWCRPAAGSQAKRRRFTGHSRWKPALRTAIIAQSSYPDRATTTGRTTTDVCAGPAGTVQHNLTVLRWASPCGALA